MRKIVHIAAEKFVLALSKEAKAVEKVPAGKPVCFETRDCFSNQLKSEDIPFTRVSWEHINPATGPVFVEGAEAGDVLRVEILDIVVAGQGVIASAPGFGSMPYSVGEVTRLIPVLGGKAVFNWPLASGAFMQRTLDIQPMIGVIGVAPSGEAVPTGTPGVHGGNMDCKRIVKGAVLYLPVAAPGALFALGDVHAVMGDGEVVVCGLEISASVTVSFEVIKGKSLPLPLLAEGDALMTLASAGTLDEAADIATRNMQSFLVSELHLEQTAAAMLLSVEGNLHICQVVDPLKTARMEISMDILRQSGYALP
jgi:amidase